jgi:glycerophosphoryl diester phosphodiesterase
VRSRDGRDPAAISAHQGGAEAHPAETYEAYQVAAESGVDYVELDVRRLRDGTLVCRHDADAGTEPLAALTYADLCARVGYEVPRVDRVLELLAGRSQGHVDVKETGYETAVVTMALDALGPSGFVVTTLVDASLHVIARAFPGVATGLSIGRGVGDVPAHRLPSAVVSDLFPGRRLRAAGASWASINKNLAPWVLSRCARLGIATMVWTVDRADQIDRLLVDSRVDVIVTNRPLYALDRRRSLLGEPTSGRPRRRR